MKRGTLFLVALLTAGATFGSLMAFVGPQNSGWNHYHRYGWHSYHHCYDDQPADSFYHR